MFLKMSAFVWGILLICIAITFAYAMLGDILSHRSAGKEGTEALVFAPMKYAAIALCAVIAVAATIISKQEAYIGSPMLALMVGIVLVNVIPERYMNRAFKNGTSFVGKKYLSLGIVCLGATLAFTDIFSAAFALPLVLFNTLLSFSVSALVGRKLLRVSSNTCILVGGGTCVCGGTAIATLAPIVKAREEETAYAMTAIFLFDLLACLSYPYLAVKLGLSATQFGFLAGTAINDTSSVVAAQETFSGLMGLEDYALPATIKVVRTSMIIVLALVFSISSLRRDVGAADSSGAGVPSIGRIVWKAFPKFILCFLGAVVLNTVLAEKAADTRFYAACFKPFFANAYKFFVTVALAGVGFKIRFREFFTKGLRPIILGGCTWFCLFLSSFAFTYLFAESMLG